MKRFDVFDIASLRTFHLGGLLSLRHIILNFGQVLAQLFRLPVIFAAIVGAPSILSLLEIMLERRFLELLEWIIDGYNRLTAIVGDIAAILYVPFVTALNGMLGTKLAVGPHWKPLFFLMLVFMSPHLFPEGRRKSLPQILWATGMVVYFMYVAVITSFVPLSPSYWQPLIAALPFAFFWLGLTEQGYIEMRRRGQSDLLRHNIVGLWIGICFCIFIGALASVFLLFSATRPVAGIFGLSSFMIVYGLFGVMSFVLPVRTSNAEDQIKEQQEQLGLVRDGLRVLSGFVLAFGIFCVDRSLDWVRALG